jgi:outer membrane lipoprotein LolB
VIRALLRSADSRGVRSLLGSLLPLIMVASCAVAPSAVPLAQTPWRARQTSLSALQHWEVSGRIAVVNEEQGWHASLHWVQQGPYYAIDLFGPLGQGRMNIQGSPQSVSVQTADGQVLQANDPEQLLQQSTGIRIPVTGLVYWLRGLPDPSRPSELTGDEQGRLTRLEQGGWVIEYPRYAAVERLELPTHIQAQRDQLRVKVVIDQWNLRT